MPLHPADDGGLGSRGVSRVGASAITTMLIPSRRRMPCPSRLYMRAIIPNHQGPHNDRLHSGLRPTTVLVTVRIPKESHLWAN